MTHRTENRLKDSASPYLRSAAHQPVDWHEWGQEAFDRARAESKPILLDIGAVWCHWCHVIDRESYENPEIAAMINQFYIPVKVDRDERPDVDARYQSAISAISGQGGWPLTAFLTPDGKPFFGGTYFPPEDALGRPGFKRILLGVAEAFKTKRSEVDSSARALEESVAKAEVFRGAHGTFDAGVLDSIVASALHLFDERHGGFGDAPKFPHPAAIDLLLERYQATRDPKLLHVAERTLEAMALGGVYDQIGGGFHRYSVDERWCVPHFEKMTYDNSELLKNFLHGYQVTQKPLFRETAEGIISWVGEVLSDRERGGFYASQDADQTLDDDGDYFTWTLAEVRAALSPEEARAMEIYYDVKSHGEMHHNPEKNVLWVATSIENLAKQPAIDEAAARLLLARAKGKLLAARRERRPIPAIDETIYVGWNAMFASAYLDAARVLRRADCRDFALKTLDRILSEAWDDSKGFQHRAGGPSLGGTLDDQVFTIAALLDAYEATLDRRYFDIAERAMRLTVERFGDPDGGGFFDRAKDAPPMGGLEVRRKPLQDSPTPGANSAAAIALDRLYGFTGERVYHDWAEKTLEAFVGLIPQYGLFAATYGLAALLHARHPLQVAITGAAGDPKAAELERAADEVYRYGKSILRVTPEQIASASLAPAVRETLPHLDATIAQALVCVETSCHPPVADPAQLRALLAEILSERETSRQTAS
ncbi:MAG: thioredoxin domain-containing protein [Candidatus Acidiferrales bacterium]